MKKILSFILVFVFISGTKAQSWCPAGATWYLGVYSSLWGYDGITEYKYTGDTLYQNKNCKIIKGTFSGQSYPDYGTLTYTYVPNFRTYFTYENNGVVYVHSGNSFDTVVNFKATIGDKWRMLHCAGDTLIYTYTVVDTAHITLNNYNLRTVKAAYVYTSTTGSVQSTYTINHVFTERLLEGLMDWQDLFGRPCFHAVHQGESFGSLMNCGYRDKDLSSSAAVGGACRLTSIKENTAGYMRVKIYPNPGAGRFMVELDRPSDIFVMNSLGAIIYERHFEEMGKYEVNIEKMPPGVYFLEAKTAGGSARQKIIKE